jgi:signal transduction histidine kinase
MTGHPSDYGPCRWPGGGERCREQAMRQTAGQIRQKKEDILRHWEERVRAEVPAAEGRSRRVLLNHIPFLLDELARAMESASPDDHQGACTASQEHAGQRAGLSDYSLEEVVQEYHLLRRAIIDVLDKDFGGNPDPRMAIHDMIDKAIQVATIEYVEINQRKLLEQAKKLQEQAAALKQLDQRKDEFIAMLAHELRNPLAPILNAASVLRFMRLDNPLLSQVQAILERQARQMSRLVDDLLDVSRVTTGKVHLRKERVELRTMVERSAETMNSLLGERNHELTIQFPREPVWVDADPVRMEQVFTNLLNNAAKYTEPGGHIWVSGEREGDEVVVRVKDTGVGMCPEILPFVFDIFSQGHRALDRSDGGLGIGLAITRSLVQMHGGSIEARSEGQGRGSEFVVRLPVASPPDRPQTAELRSEAPGRRPFRVLVVDDNRDAAESLAMLLRLKGHEVVVAGNGDAALRAAETQEPDVVFLDIGLPGMDGYELCRRLRERQSRVRPLLVAVTGYGKDGDQERARQAGFDHYLVKPADSARVEELLALLGNPTEL